MPHCVLMKLDPDTYLPYQLPHPPPKLQGEDFVIDNQSFFFLYAELMKWVMFKLHNPTDSEIFP